jgi:hypothetical protein
MARNVPFAAHLKSGDEPWRKLIKAVVVKTAKGPRKAYTVAGHEGWFAWANAKRIAKGYSSRRSHVSVRAKCKKGEITKAQAKAKLGFVPKACK